MTQTEWIISLDDDLQDYEELFVGNVRDGDRWIRCKDCVYYRPYSVGRYDCDNLLGMADAHEDEFCSRAERKEE